MSVDISKINEDELPLSEATAQKENQPEVPGYEQQIGNLDSEHTLGFKTLFFTIARVMIWVAAMLQQLY